MSAAPVARILYAAPFAGVNQTEAESIPVTADGLDKAFERLTPTIDVKAGGSKVTFAPRSMMDFDPAHLGTLLDGVDDKAAALDQLLHAPAFLTLESAWRGLDTALRMSEGAPVSHEILASGKRDLAERFHESVFDAEYDDSSEVPLALVIADFDVTHQAADLTVLRAVGGLAKAISVPFVFSAAPSFFGIKNLFHLGSIPGVMQRFSEAPYAGWRSFQTSDESRWVCLTTNRFLTRELHAIDDFEESSEMLHSEWRPWARAGWLTAAAVAGSARKHQHLADMDGMQSCGDFGDLTTFPYPVAHNKTEDNATEAIIPDEKSLELAHGGISTLLSQKGTSNAYFPILANVYRPGFGALTLEASLANQLILGDLAHTLLRAFPGAPSESAETAAAYYRDLVTIWVSRYVDPDRSDEDADGGKEGDEKPEVVEVTPQKTEDGAAVISIIVRPPIKIHNHDPEYTFALPVGGS